MDASPWNFSKAQYCSPRKNKQNHQQDVFLLKYKNCLKSD